MIANLIHPTQIMFLVMCLIWEHSQVRECVVPNLQLNVSVFLITQDAQFVSIYFKSISNWYSIGKTTRLFSILCLCCINGRCIKIKLTLVVRKMLYQLHARIRIGYHQIPDSLKPYIGKWIIVGYCNNSIWYESYQHSTDYELF